MKHEHGRAPEAHPAIAPARLDAFLAARELAVDWLRNAANLALVSAQRREDVASARFSDVRDGAWWVEQSKTGQRLCIPLALRLDAVGLSLDDVVRQCRGTGVLSKHLVHQTQSWGNSPRGREIWVDTITRRWSECIARLKLDWEGRTPPTFHEIRSLSERLYKAQGNVNTQELLGHRDPRSANLYHDARGAEWMRIAIG
ncbi:tyrosine-type recombinase/integrase [Dokdonella ginsengisoli]|uniref:Tyrosine-type recombinase/integrase n=1 Tax=Dokdonella ginsengisoli TaxID=363846 RepID=A0ABV9QWE8_9GAMM